jgi:hypothetical protein
MTLTAEQMNRIMCDEMNGAPQREHGPEADAFLEKFREERRQIEACGYSVQIPNE